MSNSEAAALCETYRAHLALGNEVVEGPHCLAISNREAGLVYNANLLWIGADAEPEPVFQFLEKEFHGRAYRNVLVDPFCPPEFTARFVHQDWVPDPTIQLLLTGALEGPPPRKYDIRRVESDSDWRALARLFREDHLETDQKQGTKIFSQALTEQIVATHRKAARDAHFFQAWVDGEAVAFFSSWPGRNGVGIVEDLFTMPAHRMQGIARALIHHCVHDARARGARQVLIGAEIDDTPKNAYAAMGFRPTCVTCSWVRRIRPDSEPLVQDSASPKS